MLPYTTSWCQDLWFAAQSYRFKERCIQLLKEHKVAALKSFFFSRENLRVTGISCGLICSGRASILALMKYLVQCHG